MNINLLALEISALKNSVCPLTDGFADAMGTSNSVNHAASSGFAYDTALKAYKPQTSEGGIITGGTPIGDMTEQGGPAGVFDGVTSQSSSGGARSHVYVDTGYVGKSFTSPKKIAKAEVWPTTNNGFGFYGSGVGGANNNPVTLQLRGKNGSPPTGPTDGTLLKEISVTDHNSGFDTLISDNQSTAFSYLFVSVRQQGADWVYMAEIKFYEPAESGGMTLESQPFTVSPQPDEVSVLAELIENEAITINEDATLEVTRDGSMWEEASLSLAVIRPGAKIYSADVDLSSQGAGTDLKWRFKTFGKSVYLSGVVVQ